LGLLRSERFCQGFELGSESIVFPLNFGIGQPPRLELFKWDRHAVLPFFKCRMSGAAWHSTRKSGYAVKSAIRTTRRSIPLAGTVSMGRERLARHARQIAFLD
jgi:hypothetical protein